MAKIYTKTGDKGTTALVSGQRVSKASLRLEAYGSLDELNAHCGLLRDLLASMELAEDLKKKQQLLCTQIMQVQNELFCLGSELATPMESLEKMKKQLQLVTEEESKRLEQEIDAMTSQVPPLANFILPGGHLCNSQAHLARTVSRRCERLIIRVDEEDGVREEAKVYINRLSDWFFMVARYITHVFLEGEEILWQPRKA